MEKWIELFKDKNNGGVMAKYAYHTESINSLSEDSSANIKRCIIGLKVLEKLNLDNVNVVFTENPNETRTYKNDVRFNIETFKEEETFDAIDSVLTDSLQAQLHPNCTFLIYTLFQFSREAIEDNDKIIEVFSRYLIC